MRYLAIDLGDKRTGIAAGDDALKIATPAEVIVATDDAQRLAGIAKALDEHGSDALVLGLPINMDDTEGPAAQRVRAFGRQLEAKFDMSVHYVDERLTSDAADELMARSGLTHGQKKARRDALAAAAILMRFFEDG